MIDRLFEQAYAGTWEGPQWVPLEAGFLSRVGGGTMPRRFAFISAFALVAALAPGLPAQAVSTDVVISQVYGGGGNSGAVYTHDFVELFNRGSTPVSLTGMSVQYTSATGTGNFGNPSTLLTQVSGTLSAGQYYLVQLAPGVGGTTPLPTPDATGVTPMSATAGKVALVNSTTSLGCNGSSTPCSPAQLALIKDLVGYGSANFFEGVAPAPNLSNTTAALRNSSGCTESDTNSTDFTAGLPNPRNTASPLSPCAIDQAPSVVSTVPVNFDLAFPPADDLAITFSEPVNVTGDWFTLYCLVGGAITTTVSGGPTTFTLDPAVPFTSGDECTWTILASQVTDQDTSDPPDAMLSDHVVRFAPMDMCLADTTAIYDIQGSGPTGAITGPVTTKGVVVGDLEGTAGLGGFYLQDPVGDADPSTSDGVFVVTGDADLVSTGQVVVVRGYARERYGQTSINGSNSDAAAVAAANVWICGADVSVAHTDVAMPFAAADAPERYEGMLVRFPQDLVISEYFNYDRYGEIVLALPLPGESRPFAGTALDEPGAAAVARVAANSLRRITLDDGLSAQNPTSLRHPNGTSFSLTNSFRGGDSVTNTVGVMGYDYSLYRVYPTGPATYSAVNPRPMPALGGTLRVASLNASNYFLTDGDLDVCGPAADMTCRGWDDAGELARQRDKLLAALLAMDADIIGITEIENTTGVEPLVDLVAGLPGYAYVDTGTIGTDAIRAGLLYRSADVTPVGGYEVLDATDDARFVDTLNRPTLAQTFRDKATGERVTVAVNHFKSKGSACSADPDTGDGQGECNLTRTNAAKALVDWLATDPTGSGDPDFLVIGDLNSYTMEDPIDAVKAGTDDTPGTADDYRDLLPVATYTYLFDGQFGALDHALASPHLAAQVVAATAWHVNADEPDVLDYDTSFKPAQQEGLYVPDPYRFGDHDPLLVGVNLVTPVEPPPVEPPPQVLPKKAQTAPKPPKRIKKRGLTVLTPKNAKTSAGQPIATKVSGKGKGKAFQVVRGKKGKVSVRTFGKNRWRLVLTRTAAGNDLFEPFSQRTVYKNGKRR